MLNQNLGLPVSVTTNPWPLAEKVSSWQIDIVTNYWISHPMEQHLANLRCCILFSAAQLPHENHEVIYLQFRKVVTGSDGSKTATPTFESCESKESENRRRKRDVSQGHIGRSAIATSIKRIKDITISAHLHPARTVSIKGAPKATQILWDATGQMSRVQTNEDILR